MDDVADMFRIMSDLRVTRYFGALPMTTPAEAQQRVQAIQTAFQEQSGVRWAIANRADGQLVGTCGFWRLLKPHDRAEIGYELAPEWWGQGVMTEALEAMLDFGFTRMGLHSLEAQIHPANSGSRRASPIRRCSRCSARYGRAGLTSRGAAGESQKFSEPPLPAQII
jgi:RimJ/RimL family protein N-acetyltransferase